jgi:hypothetical protein
MSTASFTRSEWSALSIRDRIRAMNDKLDHVEHITPPKFDVGLNNSFASMEGNSDNGLLQAEMQQDALPRRASVVDIWRKRESESPKQFTNASKTSFEAAFSDEKKEEEIDFRAEAQESVTVKDIWRDRASLSRPVNLVDAAAKVQHPSWQKTTHQDRSTSTTTMMLPPRAIETSIAQKTSPGTAVVKRSTEYDIERKLVDMDIIAVPSPRGTEHQQPDPIAPPGLSESIVSEDSNSNTKAWHDGQASERSGSCCEPIRVQSFQIDTTPTRVSPMDLWKMRTSLNVANVMEQCRRDVLMDKVTAERVSFIKAVQQAPKESPYKTVETEATSAQTSPQDRYRYNIGPSPRFDNKCHNRCLTREGRCGDQVFWIGGSNQRTSQLFRQMH